MAIISNIFVCQATLDKSVLITSSNLTLVNLRSDGETLMQLMYIVEADYSTFKHDVGFED